MKKIAEFLRNDYDKVIERAKELGFENHIPAIKQKLNDFEGVVSFEKGKLKFYPLSWVADIDTQFKSIKSKDKYIVNTSHNKRMEKQKQLIEQGIKGYIWDTGNLSVDEQKSLQKAVEDHILQKKELSVKEKEEIGMEHIQRFFVYWKKGKTFSLKEMNS